MTAQLAPALTEFSVPDGLHAAAPPEASGRPRDDVRLLVARPGGLEHARFRNLGDHLAPGDLLVVNVSATLPAAVDGIHPDGSAAVVHFSAPLRGRVWVVELRAADGSRRTARRGEVVYLPGDARVEIGEPHPDPEDEAARLWEARLTGAATVESYLARFGRPITYDYVRGRWPLDAYQTVFAREPGSAEMPSAARPFTARLVTDLVGRGIAIAPVVLHCGVSSPEIGEPPQRERFAVPEPTAEMVSAARRYGGRVVAVGTTATRALETVARRDGTIVAGAGTTELVLDASRPVRAVDGLVTGWHPPGASHLSLLEAVAGTDLVAAAYAEALRRRYLWHEFGDSCLLLPDGRKYARRAAVA